MSAGRGSHCESCGEPARVHVLEGYAGTERVLRHFCTECAPRHAARRTGGGSAPARLSLALLLALFGAALGAVGILADLFVPEAQPGFGWHQRVGLIGGAAIGLTGMLLHIDLLVLGGLLLVGATVTADWFGPRTPGLGWKQGAVVGVSLAFAGAAAAWYVFVRRRGRSADQRGSA